jgi:hypothetical protein
MRVSILAVTFLVLGLSPALRADEADAVKAIEKRDGKIIRDETQPGNPVVGVDLRRARVTDADLKLLKHLPPGRTH